MATKFKHVTTKCLPVLLKVSASNVKWIITVSLSFWLCFQVLQSKKFTTVLKLSPVTLHPTASETSMFDFSHHFIHNFILNNPKHIRAREKKNPTLLSYWTHHVLAMNQHCEALILVQLPLNPINQKTVIPSVTRNQLYSLEMLMK